VTPDPTLEDMAQQLSDDEVVERVRQAYQDLAVADRVLGVLLPEMIRRDLCSDTAGGSE